MVTNDALNIALVRWCKEFEISFGTKYWRACLNSPDDASHFVKQEKVDLIHADSECTVKSARAHSSLCHISADVQTVD